MPSLDMPARSDIRLTVTARADAGVHRWAVQVHGPAGAAPQTDGRPSYGSRIGGQDRAQVINIPQQDVDCRLEVSAQHPADSGEWSEDDWTVLEDTPGRLDIGFSDFVGPSAQPIDVLLSFAFTPPRPQT
jgi:hypothetical protein